MNNTIIAVDLVSHKDMHLPFNEGYIKTLCFAFPNQEIIFAAEKGHVEFLASIFKENDQVRLEPIYSLREQLGKNSEHNPFYSIPAARRAWEEVKNLAKGKTIQLMSVLGAASPLINVFSKKWKQSKHGHLHLVQHNQLVNAFHWRSKNPLFRYFDYISNLRRGLPAKQKLVTLELGLEDVIVKMAPNMAGSIYCLEHPVLSSEWGTAKFFEGDRPLKVGFTGHCGKGKGLDVFLKLAKKYTGDKFEFHAIGKLNEKNAGDLDTSVLKTEPKRQHVARDEFVSKLRDMDLICLPLPRNISYVSSGSIIDAFAALKPLLISSNQSLTAIQEKYGDYGHIVQSVDEMDTFFKEFEVEKFKQQQVSWAKNLDTIRKARSEESLSQSIRESVSD